MKTPEARWADLKTRTNLSRLARRLDVTRSAVSQWTRVPSEHLMIVADYLGVPAQSLRPDLYPKPDPWDNLTAAKQKEPTE